MMGVSMWFGTIGFLGDKVSKTMVKKASLVVRGDATKYISGLGKNDFAVIHAHTLYIVGDKVHGVFTDNHGRCTSFSMPICRFDELEYMEIPDSEESEVEEKARSEAA